MADRFEGVCITLQNSILYNYLQGREKVVVETGTNVE